jgi:hypothetical protein
MKFNELPPAYPHQCIGEKRGTSALVAERCSMIIVLKDGWDTVLLNGDTGIKLLISVTSLFPETE